MSSNPQYLMKFVMSYHIIAHTSAIMIKKKNIVNKYYNLPPM